nr:hypothetical protein [Tanacetum cinerariifolium]
MVNVIPPDHVDEVPVAEINQHDDVPVVPKSVLEDEDKDPEEDEFEKDKDPQEEEDDDMEIDIEEDENESELTFENLIEHEDETVPASIHETAHALVEKKGKAKDKFYGKLISEFGNEVRSSMEQGTAVMQKLVEKMNESRDLYWTRVRAYEFYQEVIRRGFVFEERPNEAINVPIKDEKSHVEIVTHWFTLIVMSALRRSDNKNMLSLAILILRYYESLSHAGNPVKEILLKVESI